MRIAVFSDTHDRYPDRLPELLKGADEIWHLGDVCEPEVLVEFEQWGLPLRIVQGNNDSHPWPVYLLIERGGVEFYLTHIPPKRAPKGVRTILHGHTHVSRDDLIDGVRWLNPGCISQPRGEAPGFAWLDVAEGEFTWTVVPL